MKAVCAIIVVIAIISHQMEPACARPTRAELQSYLDKLAELLGINHKSAALEQECDVQPTCNSGDTFDSCKCWQLTGSSSSSTCSGGGQRVELGGECSCAYVANLECSSGYTLKNCECKSSSGNTEDPSCPAGSYRPTSSSCYCVALTDTICSSSNTVISSDKCNCNDVESYTPSCSNSDVCKLDESSCSCGI